MLTPPRSDYFAGLDLGQSQDFTALAVVERPRGETPGPADGTRQQSGRDEAVYFLRGLKRFPLGTPYTTIAADVVRLTGTPPLKDCTLVVDKTGVGAPVVDLLLQGKPSAYVRPLLVTSGHGAGWGEDGSMRVPKSELVSNLQVLFQTRRRLRIAEGIPEAAALVKEIDNFRVKITASANETFEAWREGDHDDLVFAVAMACWWAEVIAPRGAGAMSVVKSSQPSLFERSKGNFGSRPGRPGEWRRQGR